MVRPGERRQGQVASAAAAEEGPRLYIIRPGCPTGHRMSLTGHHNVDTLLVDRPKVRNAERLLIGDMGLRFMEELQHVPQER